MFAPTHSARALILFSLVAFLAACGGGSEASPAPGTTGATTTTVSYDGKDPKQTGCELDAKNLGVTSVVKLSDGSDLGQLQMRYSKKCQTAWGSIYLSSPTKPDAYRGVKIVATRQEGEKLVDKSFETKEYDDPIWGDMVDVKPGSCVYVTALINEPGFGSEAQSDCLSP